MVEVLNIVCSTGSQIHRVVGMQKMIRSNCVCVNRVNFTFHNFSYSTFKQSKFLFQTQIFRMQIKRSIEEPMPLSSGRVNL